MWAAGLTFFEMLTGRRAYCGDSFASLACAIRSDPVPSVSAIRSDLPASFDRVLATALRKQRSRRYPSAAEFRAAVLDAWVDARAIALASAPAVSRFRTQAATLPQIDQLYTDLDEATDLDIEIDVEVDMDTER